MRDGGRRKCAGTDEDERDVTQSPENATIPVMKCRTSRDRIGFGRRQDCLIVWSRGYRMFGDRIRASSIIPDRDPLEVAK